MWWSLTRDAVGSIRQFVADNPVAVAWFRYVRVPDEMFFQSLLKQLRPHAICYDETAPSSPQRPPNMAATTYVDLPAR